MSDVVESIVEHLRPQLPEGWYIKSRQLAPDSHAIHIHNHAFITTPIIDLHLFDGKISICNSGYGNGHDCVLELANPESVDALVVRLMKRINIIMRHQEVINSVVNQHGKKISTMKVTDLGSLLE